MQFYVAIIVQLVTVIGLVLNYLKSNEAVSKVAVVDNKVIELAISVDGQMTRLLAEKDAHAATTEKAAFGEGLAQGVSVGVAAGQMGAAPSPAPAPPVVVINGAPLTPTAHAPSTETEKEGPS